MKNGCQNIIFGIPSLVCSSILQLIVCNTDRYYGEYLALNGEKLAFLFGSSCVSIKKIQSAFLAWYECACPGGACVGTGSSVGHVPPMTVLFGHLPRVNCPHRTPLNCVFLTAPMAASEISLVQITAPYFGLGGFLHDHFETTMVGTCFNGKFHTFSALPDRKSLLPSCRFHSSRPRYHRPYARSYHHRKRYPSGY